VAFCSLNRSPMAFSNFIAKTLPPHPIPLPLAG
jgi:hypothetical protein